jgi:RNA methyltransferase, TrmH family
MKLDDIRKLHQKKYREQFGCFIVEGEHLVLELQKAAKSQPALRTTELYVCDAYEHWQSSFRTHVIETRQMARIADTKTPQGILAVVHLSALVPAAPLRDERAIYLHEIQDPGNLGSILRTLAWFGGFRCLLGPGSVDPFNSKVVRASMGAIFHVPIELDVAVSTLPQRYSRIAALDMQGRALPDPVFRHFDCYVFGNEARGLPEGLREALSAELFTIPGHGAIDSLNLATTVNISLYEISTGAQLLA